MRNTKGEFYVHHNAKANEFFFPGGKVNTGETVAQAAVRELQEELSITTSVDHIVSLSVMKCIHGGVKRCFHMVDVLQYEGEIIDCETKYNPYRAEVVPSDTTL